jgi:hypothetical protein
VSGRETWGRERLGDRFLVVGWGFWKRGGGLGGRGLDRKRRRVRNQCCFIFVSLLFLREEKITYVRRLTQ